MTSTPGTPPELSRSSSSYRWTILGAGILGQASFSAVLLGLPAIAPPLRRHFDLSLTEVGVLLAAISMGSLATLLLWGLLTDRIGERRVIALGLTGCAGALVGAAYASSFPGLVVALAAAGALGAGVNSATGRAVMTWFGAEERGLALGIRQTAVPLGGAAAAVSLPALAQLSLRAAFLGLAVACLVSAIVGVALLRVEPAEEQGELFRPLRDARIWRLCLGSTFYVATQISLLGFLVLFLHDRLGYSTALAAGALALTQVLGGAARIVAGYVSDRLQQRIAPLRLVALLLALTAGLTALLVDAPASLLFPALLAAGTLSLAWNGLSFTATAEAAGRARAGAALGLQQTFLAAGSIVAPIGFGAVVNAGSWRTAFALAALSPLVGYALLRKVPEELGRRSAPAGRRSVH